MLEIVLWILVGVAALIGLDQLFLWMEAKGWLYYRKVKRKGGGWGDVFLGGNVFDPGARNLQEARQEHVNEDEDDGDDDGKRKSDDRLT